MSEAILLILLILALCVVAYAFWRGSGSGVDRRSDLLDESPSDKDLLRTWAAVTGPYEHMVWVGAGVSIADVKRWVRRGLSPSTGRDNR